MTKLSILIPNYNGGKKLERAIESCKNIDLDNEDFEIRVLDNRSTDNSVEIVRDLQEDFDNLELEENPENFGRIGNWNRCIEQAQGEHMVFLFVNEQIAPENNISNVIEELDNRDLPFCKSGNIALSKTPANDIKDDFDVESVRKRLRKDIIADGTFSFGPLQTYVFDTEFLQKSEVKFDEDYGIMGDQDFIIRLGRQLEEDQNDDSFLTTNSRNIIWDDETDRFNTNYNDSDDIEENFEWYVERNIRDYTSLPRIFLSFVRLSDIKVYNLLHRISGGRFARKFDGSKIREYEGPYYPLMSFLSYFYIVKWISVIRKLFKSFS